MKARNKKILAMMLALSVSASTMPMTSLAAETSNEVSIVFSDEGISADENTTGFEISDTTLKITESGCYRISGNCSNGNVVVKKSVTDVVLVLDNLTLTSETTAPICCNKSTGVEIIVKENTVNTLSDTAENANSENEDAESAVIKAKSGAALTIDGTGTLNINGVAKNGIKGAAETTVTVDELTLNVSAVNNGIASDDKVIINGGIVDINAGNEGIKSEPENTVDETTGEVTLEDTVSAGQILLNNGIISIQAAGDGVQAYNDLIVENGTIKVNSAGDGLQGTNVTINNGDFDIITNGGYTTKLSDDADSCKGVKATSTIVINDGQFTLNSADDAIHTNEYVYLNGGSFDIKTGDDAAHADTSLFVGEENADDSKLNINVLASFEGLEAGTVYMNSGNVNVVSSDDGVNAAGGSSNGTDTGNGMNDNFNPGGGGRPGFGMQPVQGSTGDYSININGGNYYINASGDGLDSNGNITMSNGKVVVFGAAAGSDNSPVDCDGQFAISGGTLFGAGSAGMAYNLGSYGSSQKCITSMNNISQGKYIVVSDSNSNILFETEAVKNVNYVIYSSSEMEENSSYTISATNTAAVTAIPTKEAEVTKAPEPTQEAEVSEAPKPTQEAEVSEAPKPTQEAEVSEAPKPTQEVEATKAPKPTQEAEVTKTPEPTQEAEATKAPEPTQEAEVTKAPKPTQEAEVTRMPKPTKEAEVTKVPEPTKEAEVTRTPEPTEEAEVTEAPEPTEEAEVTKAPVNKKKMKGKVTSKNSSSVIVKWNKVEDADYYEIYRASSKNGTYKKIKTINNVKTTSYTDNKLKCGKTYYYIVKSYQIIDDEEICIGECEAACVKVVPTKTSIKTVKSQKNKITIKWKKASGVSGYEIFRATSKNGKYKKIATVTKASKVTYTNKNLKSDKKYYYKVRAYKKVNGKKVYGEYSVIKSATTK